MCGVALLNFISCFVTVRQFLTDSICFRRLYESMTPDSTLALETKRTLEEGFRGCSCKSVSGTEFIGMNGRETHRKHFPGDDGLDGRNGSIRISLCNC